MYPDVSELRNFYASQLGLMARRIVGHRIRARWRDTRGLTVAGIGYATPFLRQFMPEAGRVLALMPQAQGAVAWPGEGPYTCALVDEMHLPLPDVSIDRLLLVHCLEHTEASDALLREVWRVLAPEGHLMVIVPNRRGLWASSDATPFGAGRPFSQGQIETRLSSALFNPVNVSPALFLPPVNWRPLIHTAVAWERAGSHVCPFFGGIIIAEAVKRVYAGLREPRLTLAHARRAFASKTASKPANRIRPVPEHKVRAAR
jgi:SAM-dependent methyltransferase